MLTIGNMQENDQKRSKFKMIIFNLIFKMISLQTTIIFNTIFQEILYLQNDFWAFYAVQHVSPHQIIGHCKKN